MHPCDFWINIAMIYIDIDHGQSSRRLILVLDRMLTCGDIAPFRANALHALFPPSITDTTDDKPQPVPPEVRIPSHNDLGIVYI